MCGIAGIVTPEGNASQYAPIVEKMLSRLRHRGPDEQGIHVTGDGHACLGHQRLSIIDLESGHQPLCDEEGKIWVTYNGEIYDHMERRKDLEERGHRFRTRCDTEILVHLYEDEGRDMLDKLRGMFAFAIWDGTEKSLLLARDRLGQKPLVYAEDQGRLAFASELGALMEVPWVRREVDPHALDLYLTYQYVPHPKTILKGAKKLPPAHMGLWRKGRFETSRYWQLDPTERPIREGEALERLKLLLREAVSMRLMSDVPLGAFLSGGIDSSIIVALMAEKMSSPPKTFSIGFQDKRYDELPYARQVAKHLGTDHQEFTVKPHSLDVLPDLVTHYGEPFADSSAIPTLYLSQMTAQKVKVALSGDGGDELFHGYPRYKAVRLGSIYDRFPSPVKTALGKTGAILPDTASHWIKRGKRFLSWLHAPPLNRYLGWIDIFSEEDRKHIVSPDLSVLAEGEPSSFLLPSFQEADALDAVSQMAFVDLHTYLPCDILTKVDIASMAHSLECRSPFLDHKLVEFVVSLPGDLKMRRMQTKHILKEAFGQLLPEKILRRRKKGFGVPVASWFRSELHPYLQDTLLRGHCIRKGWLQEKGVETLIAEHVSGARDHGYRLWSLVVLEEWCRRFLKNPVNSV